MRGGIVQLPLSHRPLRLKFIHTPKKLLVLLWDQHLRSQGTLRSVFGAALSQYPPEPSRTPKRTVEDGVSTGLW